DRSDRPNLAAQLQVVDEGPFGNGRGGQRGPAIPPQARDARRGHDDDRQQHDEQRALPHLTPTSTAAARSGSTCGSLPSIEKTAMNVRTLFDSPLGDPIGESCSRRPVNCREGNESSVTRTGCPTRTRVTSA